MIKNKKYFKILTVLTVLVMSICMLTGCGKKENKEQTPDYEEPIKNFIEGMVEANSEKFLNAFPEFLSKYMKQSFTNEDLSEILEDAKEEYGEDLKMTYKVVDKKELSEEELKQMQEDLKENYGQESSVSAGYNLNVEINTKGSKKEETDKDEYTVYKIDEKWCMIEL